MNQKKILQLLPTVVIGITLFLLSVSETCAQTPIKSKKFDYDMWTIENLNVTKFRNGDPIPQAKTPEAWKLAAVKHTPAWCYYDNNPENGKIYGKLYNWYAVNDKRGLAPKGWRVAGAGEWIILEEYLGGGTRAGRNLMSTSGWAPSVTGDGNGTDSSGFRALPGGLCDTLGIFSSSTRSGNWWSADASTTNPGYSLGFTILHAWGILQSFKYSQGVGCAVRCVRE
jgi:uncharacterized protein (TIGR02145 family)